jgi:malonate transporter
MTLVLDATPAFAPELQRGVRAGAHDLVPQLCRGWIAADCRSIRRVTHHLCRVAVASGSVVLSPLTLAILEANKAFTAGSKGSGLVLRAVGRSLLNPVVLSPIIGIAVAFLRIPLADAIREAFTLIGQATGGAALFLTGLILSSQPLLLDRNVISGALLKNVAQPLFVAGLILLVPMHKDTARAAILLTALPSGFFGVLFGLRYGVESHEAGSTLIVSTILSALTLATALILTAAS